jgi:hypothetical protein
VVTKDEEDKPLDPVMMDDLLSSYEGNPDAETDAAQAHDNETKKEENEIEEQSDADTTIKLRHASLGDYLRSFEIKRTRMTARLFDGELELASFCMQIMCDPSKILSALWTYATQSWLQHLAKVDLSSASREQVFHIALMIAQTLTSPESAKRMIEFGDMDSIYWENTASATGAQYRDVVLKWLVKAHSLGLTADKDSDLHKWIEPTGLGLRNPATGTVTKKTGIVDSLNVPKSLNAGKATTTSALKPGSASDELSAENNNPLDSVLMAQLQAMVTTSVATAFEQVLKRLKDASTGEFILEEPRFGEPGNDIGLPLDATNDDAGAQVDRDKISVDAVLGCIDTSAFLADDRQKELRGELNFL